MTVPAASRVLIPASRPAQRFTPSEAAAARPAVVLAPVTARADEHLAPASGTEKQSGIVHCSPRREGWTIRDHRAILHSEPYASADLGAASDVTAKSVQSEAASASSPTPISLQLTSDVIAGTRGARLLWQAASAQGGNNDTSQAGAVGRFSAGSLRPAQSVHEGCSPNNRAFSQPPTPVSRSWFRPPPLQSRTAPRLATGGVFFPSEFLTTLPCVHLPGTSIVSVL